MKVGAAIVEFAVRRPKTVTAFMVLMTLAFIALAGAPSVWPKALPFLSPVHVDTDPENMLPADEPVRAFHDRMKKTLSLYDMVVVGVVNDSDPHGVFNPDSLRRIHALTEFAKTLRWPDPDRPGEWEGVVAVDVIAPSTVDNIEQGGPGEVRFGWLMPEPPTTEAEALAVRDKARHIPFLNGTLVSDDGKAVALYLPLTRKDLSYRVSEALQRKIAELSPPGTKDVFHITGLPVAEDTFGVEMFRQMAISAPLAMLVIFILLFIFFRKFSLIVQPLIVALVSVVWTMGLLIVTGQTIHIMSSMIPIFIMPIAVLDSIHILSEFFDRYQETRDRRKTITRVMETLFVPMLYTSLTTAAGFASLGLTPIPPVQVFGFYIAFGVMVAWVFTVMFIPASVLFIPQRYLENFGLKKGHEDEQSHTLLSRFLRWVGQGTYRWARLILVITAVVVAVAAVGIIRIRFKDNPSRWFEASHPIRVAEHVLNQHFGGTYMAYLALEAEGGEDVTTAYLDDVAARARAYGKAMVGEYPEALRVFEALAAEVPHALDALGEKAPKAWRKDAQWVYQNGEQSFAPLPRAVWLDGLDAYVQARLDAASGAEADAWDQASLFVSAERQRSEVFKQPEVLRYIEGLQAYLLTPTDKVVGKSNSLADITKTVYRELTDGSDEHFCVPDTAQKVADCLMQYQSSHRPQDLDHFVTPDYRTTSVWVQLTSGDNRDMARVVDLVESYLKAAPPPVPLRHEWFGLTYINVIWQNRMVVGMLQSFLGSFLVVFLMMIVLYRSALWGLLAMVPLTVTIGAIYGAVGFLGKDYDMPIAVLSALSLGLAVDYAIHFLSRTRQTVTEHPGTWKDVVPTVFGEPARAIARNVVVIGVGFLPLLAAPLVPYKTVGVFMAAILLLAGLVTLLILPAMVRVLEPLLFPKTKVCCLTCHCLTCMIASVALVGAAALNIQLFLNLGWNRTAWYSLAAVAVLASLCGLLSRRRKCRTDVPDAAESAKGDAP